MTRSLMGVIFCGKKSTALTLGFVLYLKNVTGSQGRSGGDYVGDRINMTGRFGGGCFHFCRIEFATTDEIFEHRNKVHFPPLITPEKKG